MTSTEKKILISLMASAALFYFSKETVYTVDESVHGPIINERASEPIEKSINKRPKMEASKAAESSSIKSHTQAQPSRLDDENESGKSAFEKLSEKLQNVILESIENGDILEEEKEKYAEYFSNLGEDISKQEQDEYSEDDSNQPPIEELNITLADESHFPEEKEQEVTE